MNKRDFLSQRPLLVWTLAYGLGLMAGAFWKGFLILLPVLGILFAIASALLTRQNRLMRGLSLCFAFFFLGLLLAGHAAHPARPPEGTYQVSARVTGESEQRAGDGRVKELLRGVRLTDENGLKYSVRGAYWTYYQKVGGMLPKDGQTADFEANLYYPEGQVNPYGFDFSSYLLQNDIQVGISGALDVVFTPETLLQPQSIWLRARESIAGLLDRIFMEESGLPKALLIGERSGLEDEMTADFREAGIAHVLAVSGLHVSLLVAGIFFILKAFRLSPRVLFACIAIFLLFYCRLLDFTPSIVRASILTLAYLLGRVVRRRVDPLTSLAFAFLLILVFRPLDLFVVGFQLSFLAVLGIFTLGDSMTAWVNKHLDRRKTPSFIRGIIQAYIITFSASLMTMIPIVNTFHRFSLIGLIIGPAAVLLIGVLMAGFLALLLLGLVSLPAAQFLAQPLILLTQGYQAGVQWAAARSYASLPLPAFSWYHNILFYAILILFSRYLRLSGRKRVLSVLAFAGAALIIGFLPHADYVSYIQFSAGNADCAVIRDGPQTWVIDTGSHGGDLSNFLLSEGLVIDKLFLSHLHDDHVGGLRQLLDSRVTIRQILLPYGAREAEITDESLELLQEAEAAGIPQRVLGRGDALSSDRVSALVLWPRDRALYPGLDPNAGSLVMRLNLDGVTLLTDGDISADYAGYAVSASQILKVPHHGSKADANRDVLNMVLPQFALITASDTRPDRYQAAEKNLAAVGAVSLVTGGTGAVTLGVKNGELFVNEHLKRGE